MRIADLAIEIPLYGVSKLDAVPARLKGFTGNPTNTGPFWNVHTWTLRVARARSAWPGAARGRGGAVAADRVGHRLRPAAARARRAARGLPVESGRQAGRPRPAAPRARPRSAAVGAVRELAGRFRPRRLGLQLQRRPARCWTAWSSGCRRRSSCWPPRWCWRWRRRCRPASSPRSGRRTLGGPRDLGDGVGGDLDSGVLARPDAADRVRHRAGLAALVGPRSRRRSASRGCSTW